MVDVFVGIGSNVSPVRHLREAVDALTTAFGVPRSSSVYRNPPVGFDGEDFLNMVVGFDSDAGVGRIETVLSELEQCAGRRRPGAKFGPRTLDLDLLLYGRCVDPLRRLPREDLTRYGFAVGPLAELAPDLPHPLSGVPIGELWAAMRPRCPPLCNLGALAELTAEAADR